MAQISLWIILTNVCFICEFRWIHANVFKKELVFANTVIKNGPSELKIRIKRDTENVNSTVTQSCNFNSKFTCICENCFNNDNCCTTLFGDYVVNNSMQITLIFQDDYVYNSTNERFLKSEIKNSVLQYCQIYKEQCVNMFNVTFSSIEYLNYSREALSVFILDIDFQNRTSVGLLVTTVINNCIDRERNSICDNITSTDFYQNTNNHYVTIEPKFLALILQNQSIYLKDTLGLKTMFTNENFEAISTIIDVDDDDAEAKKRKIYKDLIIMGSFFGTIMVISCFASVIKSIKDRRTAKRRIIQKRREKQEKANGECTMASGEVKHCNGNMLEEGAAMNGHVNKHDVTVTMENGINNATNLSDAYAPPPYPNGKLESSKPAKDISNKTPDAVMSNGGVKNGGASLFAPHVVTIENHPCSDKDAMQSSNDHPTNDDDDKISNSDVLNKTKREKDTITMCNNPQEDHQNNITDNIRSKDQIEVNATIENVKETDKIDNDADDKRPQICDDSKDESKCQDNLDNMPDGKECKFHSGSSGVIHNNKLDEINSLDCDDDTQKELSNNSDHDMVVENKQKSENCDSKDVEELKTRI